ncbi:hypothetical protein F5Y14DRAFT_422577 [Nemania sp. NC0429]|nr:hypothetical protein F5Y14DRAFT_422577 [Nemania sp. NC0429]
MDRYLGHLWAVPSIMKPEGKKLKRKAPKAGTSPQQRPYSVNYSDTKMMMTPESKPHKSSSSPFHLFGGPKPSAPQQRPALPPPTKSDDGKWLEDFRKNGYLYRDGRRNSRLTENERTPERPVSMMAPEFAHLAAVPAAPPETTTTTTGPPIKNAPPPQMTRRYAKTPVSHIGQLETHPLLRTQGTSQDVPTIESIAESYRALLESRASSLSLSESHSTENHDGFFNPQDPTLVPPPLEPVTELPEPPPARGSPRSDDGTLVEEDATDAKHSHVSSTLSSPTHSSYETAPLGPERRAAGSPLRSPDMQTCLDLLTRELSLAANNHPPAQPGADTAALQIWVMIEAYEKLRDQVLGSHERDGPLRATFDTWLTALRSVHDGMVGGDGERSESNYDD